MTADNPEPLGCAKTSQRPRILLLSAYDAGSHVRWRNWLTAALPEFEWHTLSLPPRYFRWRIRGNPLSWLNEPLLDEPWDALVVTTMVDLATLRGLKPRLAGVPALAYCHENQFVYPERGTEKANAEPLMVNLYTGLAAECLLFNSEWNRRSFLSGVGALMSRLPDRKPDNLQALLMDKSAVVPVPIDDRLYTEPLFDPPERPHLLWNHRWEFDKGPDRLLFLLRALRKLGFPFYLSVVGERFRQQPGAFAEIAREFTDCIVKWGYQESETDYRQLLVDADIVLSTALHDFQGLAVLEAMAGGCYPWVPDRLAYPEYVSDFFLYESVEHDRAAEADNAAESLQAMWRRVRQGELKPLVPDAYRSSRLVEKYRQALRSLLG